MLTRYCVLPQWFIGRELNPRIGSFDIKTFNEMRPGLILWILIDISCACHQWVTLGGRVTDSMLLVCAFHAWYVLDAEWNEVSARRDAFFSLQLPALMNETPPLSIPPNTSPPSSQQWTSRPTASASCYPSAT